MADGERSNGNSVAAPTLTTRQGHPVVDNQNSRTIGDRGPTVLENYHLLEKISHFDRERIPERVVHARGAGAHGFFEASGMVADEPIARYTRARLFQARGKCTPLFARFSTVIHGNHSPETLRDPRGFALKFYTEDGNWDLVGNNLQVFFIRDAMKFPDLVHAFKPDPVTNRQDNRRIFDFVSHSPSTMHMITWLFSPWGIPATFREMRGSGVHAYKWVNDAGEAVLVKYHFLPAAGERNLTLSQAQQIQATNFNHASEDLYDAIAAENYPEWKVCVQIMEDSDHPELDFDPLDATKLWPTTLYPLRPIGRIVLDGNPRNFFAEVEQVAFGTGVMVDGMDFSDDKLLQGRTFSYSDTQRYRVGPNYLQLPINRPHATVATNQRDGQMTYRVDGDGASADPHVNYEPTGRRAPHEAPLRGAPHQPMVSGQIMRKPIARTNDYGQAGDRYRSFEPWERDDLILNLGTALRECDRDTQTRMVDHLRQCDPDYGQRVAEALGLGGHGDGVVRGVQAVQPLSTTGTR
jgi:catalase